MESKKHSTSVVSTVVDKSICRVVLLTFHHILAYRMEISADMSIN